MVQEKEEREKAGTTRERPLFIVACLDQDREKRETETEQPETERPKRRPSRERRRRTRLEEGKKEGDSVSD